MSSALIYQDCLRYTQAQTIAEKDDVLRSLRYTLERADDTGAVSSNDIRAAWKQRLVAGNLTEPEEQALSALFRGYERLIDRKWTLAITQFDQAMKAAPPNDDGTPGLISCRAQLGRVMAICEDRRYDEALTEAMRVPGISDDPTARASAPALQAERDHIVGLALRRMGRGEEAEDRLIAARNGYERIGDSVGKARALDTLGMIYRDEGRFQDAIYCYQLSMQLKSLSGEKRSQAVTAGNIGRMYLDWEEYDRALTFLEQDLQTCREIDDRIGMIIALHELAETYMGQDRLNEARRRLEEANALLNGLPDVPVFTRANVEYSWAQLAITEGNFNAAQGYHDRAVNYFGTNAAPTVTAYLDLQQGRIEAGKFNFGSARQLIDRAAETFQAMKQDLHRAQALFQGAVVLIRQDTLNEAVTYLTEALNLARQHSAENMVARFQKACRQIDSEALMLTLLKVKSLNEQLRENQRWQQSLADTVTHDLKTPVTIITGNMQLALLELETLKCEAPPEIREYLDVAVRQCNWLIELIGSILDMGKMESGALKADPEVVPLTPLVTDAVADFGPDITQKPVQVSRDPHDVNLTVMVNPTLARRVLINLISNAVKYGQRPAADAAGFKSYVTVRVERNGNEAKVSVSDTGMGISADDQAKLFTKYGQLNQKVKNSTGLGLYFCKLAVEAMGGRIGVESVLGTGTTFWFTLPLSIGV